MRVGDLLVSIGDQKMTSDASFGAFRTKYNGTTAQTLPLVVRRGGELLTQQLPVRLATRTVVRVLPLANASPKAVRIRSSLVRG